MKYKLKSGMQVELHDEDIKGISKLDSQHQQFSGKDMKQYFQYLHTHAMQKMQHISDHIVTDQNSIDAAAEYVMKFGTFKDFVKFIRYQMDANVAYHVLQSLK